MGMGSADTRMPSIVGYALLYVGAVNVWFARYAETCTMGNADGLWGGAVTLVAYLLGLSLLWIGRPPRMTYLLLLPVLGSIWMQTSFTVAFAFGVWISAKSACEVLQGVPSDFDGRESIFAVLWILLSLSALVGVVALLSREFLSTRRAAPPAG